MKLSYADIQYYKAEERCVLGLRNGNDLLVLPQSFIINPRPYCEMLYANILLATGDEKDWYMYMVQGTCNLTDICFYAYNADRMVKYNAGDGEKSIDIE